MGPQGLSFDGNHVDDGPSRAQKLHVATSHHLLFVFFSCLVCWKERHAQRDCKNACKRCFVCMVLLHYDPREARQQDSHHQRIWTIRALCHPGRERPFQKCECRCSSCSLRISCCSVCNWLHRLP